MPQIMHPVTKVCNELDGCSRGAIKENQSKIRLAYVGSSCCAFKAWSCCIDNQKILRDNSSHLSLIEKNEFEDWLMFKVMVTKAETQYRGAVVTA